MGIFPFLKDRALRISNITLILISLCFSKSGMLAVIVLGYGIALLIFSSRLKVRIWLMAFASGILISLTTIYHLSINVQNRAAEILQSLISYSPRFAEMQVSILTRISYFLMLIYTLLETKGLGLGIGQYGHFWKDIYLRHIDYKAFDLYGEIARALASTHYMRPWSVVLGIGADLGLVGLVLISVFLYQVFAESKTAHARAVVIMSVFILLGMCPIVTPHIWIALGLMGGQGMYMAVEENQDVISVK
jgi:hypothetical protein